ncbi:MAG TPA: inositol monophosphatase family protein, partial [Galbitalea sp.]
MTQNPTVAPAPGACAHRGDSSRYRENTLPSIRSALQAGAEFVEVDVRLTADGSVIVLHDSTLERLWEYPIKISQTSHAFVIELGDREHRPPLLAEVLELCEGSESTLLIDMEESEFAGPAYRVAATSTARVAWCGDLDGLRRIRSLDADASIWMPWDTENSPTPADIAELAPAYINSEFLWMTAAMVKDIHALGCKVAVWTIDDEFTMRWATSIGVDTVTTNQLKRLQGIVDDAQEGGSSPQGGPGGVDLDAVLTVARDLARWAIDYSSSQDPGMISTKADAADLVTEVDVAVERHVREVVGERFPGYGFVGEELGGAAMPGVPCWYLDPVDGTTNFANRIPWNAFSLALALDDQPLVGVVADPWRGDLFEAITGRGAKLNGRILTITTPDAPQSKDPLNGRVVATELASHLAWPGMLEMLQTLGERHCTMRIMGSGTMTLVGVAAGRGVGSVIGSFGAVDHLAAVLIVQESGGTVLDSAGEERLFPESGGILVAAPHAAAELYRVWQDACTKAAA